MTHLAGPESGCALHADAAAAPPCGSHGALLRECLAANYSRLHARPMRHLGCPDLATESLHDAWLRLGEPAAAGRCKARRPTSIAYAP
jgi:RNA polymerase sigma-70 factor (ECF subfamily)